MYHFEHEDGPRALYCNNSIAGGGWRLVSARTHDTGVLFADDRCLSPEDDCSGRLFEDELRGDDGTLLLATSDGEYWLAVSSNQVLDEFLSLQRPLDAENFCDAPHFCEFLDVPLTVVDHSPSFVPLALEAGSLWIMSGGLALRVPNDESYGHYRGQLMAAFNLAEFDRDGGAFFLTNANYLGNVVFAVAGEPGALYYR